MIIFVNKFQKHISGYFNRYNFEKNFVNVKIIQNKIELSKYYYRKIFIRPPRAPWGPLDSRLMNEKK